MKCVQIIVSTLTIVITARNCWHARWQSQCIPVCWNRNRYKTPPQIFFSSSSFIVYFCVVDDNPARCFIISRSNIISFESTRFVSSNLFLLLLRLRCAILLVITCFSSNFIILATKWYKPVDELWMKQNQQRDHRVHQIDSQWGWMRYPCVYGIVCVLCMRETMANNH